MIILFESDPSSVSPQVIIVGPSLQDQHLGRKERGKQNINKKETSKKTDKKTKTKIIQHG